MPATIAIQISTLDFATERLIWNQMIASEVGAAVEFVGYVRAEQHDELGALQFLQIEHYPVMTENALTEIATKASARWPAVLQLQIIHRIGRLNVGEHIVWVACAGAHRSETFAVCEFIMDYLKTEAPFWKKAIYENGEQWVAAKLVDEALVERWQRSDHV